MTDLTNEIIEKIKIECVPMIKETLGDDLYEIILYGSVARGDYSVDSDIDMALLTRCGRMESKKYGKELAVIATDLAMKYFAVVNFVCLPREEYDEKKAWYPYFRNIASEGISLYGG